MKKIVFFGTSSFAVPALRALASDPRFSVVEVITQPDRPVGRHAEMTETPVKQAAKELGLPVYEKLSGQSFDAAVVASYGNIIKQDVLDLAPQRFLNIHASLLPAYRGASPIREAIKNGDPETGVTIMEMDAKMDHGPILSVHKEPILKDDDTPALTERLAVLGAAVIGDTLAGVLDGTIKPVAQDESKATYVKLLTREDGRIDADMPPEAVERLIRANRPWPGTYLEKNGKRLKILEAHLENGALVFDTVQPEGKTAQSWAAFLRGNRDWN